MTTRNLPLFLVLALTACSKNAPEQSKAVQAPAQIAAVNADDTSDPHAAFTNVAVEDMAKLLAAKQATPVDANGAETRQELGCVPGAIRLSSYDSFASSELPADKSTPLVFYCGGEACTAAPKAAARAKAAGFTQVSVMRAGIHGWVGAGKPVERS